MKLPRHYTAHAFLIGCCISSMIPHTYTILIILLSILTLSTFLIRSSRWYSIVLSIILGTTLMYAYILAWRHTHLHFSRIGTQITSEHGVVSKQPDVRANETRLTITLLDGTKALVTAPRFPEWTYGDVVTLSGKIEKPKSSTEFDYAAFLEFQEITGVMRRPTELIKTGSDPPSRILATLYRWRSLLDEYINRHLPEPESSFLSGILLGGSKNLPLSLQEALRTTGTSHMVAISGANITIILSILEKRITLPRNYRFIAISLIALTITLLTGASSSVTRGALVVSLSAFLTSRSRPNSTIALILTCIVAMLLINPLVVRDPGFQLSFAAFAGLSWFSPSISRVVSRVVPPTIPPIITESFTQTLAATIATAPISLITFGQISFLGLIVNPLVLGALPAITCLGFLLICGFALPSGALLLISVPLWFLLHTVLACISFFGQATTAVISWKPALINQIIICGSVILLVYVPYLYRCFYNSHRNLDRKLLPARI